MRSSVSRFPVASGAREPPRPTRSSPGQDPVGEKEYLLREICADRKRRGEHRRITEYKVRAARRSLTWEPERLSVNAQKVDMRMERGQES